MAYDNLAFPHAVGGPGPVDTLVLAITATGTTSSTPVTAQTDIVAYNAASANNQARHNRFSAIVKHFQQYGPPISLSSDGDNITMTFERKSMFENKDLGQAPWFDKGNRSNAYDLAAAFVAANDHTVTVIGVTLNGAAQSGT
jgi:hypothetical protein